MGTGKRLLNKIIAILMILVMMLAKCAIVGKAVIAYAVQAVETNNKNVTILAYFENENEFIDKSDLILNIEVNVKNDDGLGGYFEGEISLGDSNFKLKDQDAIQVYVTAGETKKIQVPVEYLDTNQLTKEYLSKESRIAITGLYKNSEKEYSIQGETTVKLNWISNDNISSKLLTKVLTNSIYSLNGENKRIVQMLIGSKIEGNEYPIKSTVVEMIAPEGVEQVTVHKRMTNATNGDKEFTEENYTYDEQTNKLNIHIENSEENISWVKDSYDIFVVTYICDENVQITGTEMNIDSKITLYDNKELIANSLVTVENEQDGLVTGAIIENENSIYKGKIYTGEEREYISNTQINIDFLETINNIEIVENKAKFLTQDTEKEAIVNYIQTSISKENFLNIFGDEGYLTIKDQEQNIIANINKDTETDENGNILINYSSDITNLNISTSQPKTIGILNIKHKKKIVNNEYSREEVKELTKIRETIKVGNNTVEKDIDLNETESVADLQLETTSLSTTEENQILNMKVTLDTSDESKDLYKNPTVKINLPSQIQITNAKYRVLYDNGLESKSAEVTKENGQNVITIKLSGEQTSYLGEAINGTVIDISLEVDVDNLAVNSTEKIILNYTNENATNYFNNGEVSKDIQIVSESTMILTNSAEQAGITTQGSEEEKQVMLEVNSEATTEQIDIQIINNEGASISDVAILGEIPTIEGAINLASEVNVGTEATVYYTNVDNPSTDLSDTSNSWNEQATTDSKNYLVLIDNLDNTEKVTMSYSLSIQPELSYNLYAEESYQVSYTNSTTNVESTVESSTLSLATVSSAVFEESFVATVGGKQIQDGEEVSEGEIITYEYTIKNIGSIDAENVNITQKVPEGTTLVEMDTFFWKSDDDDILYINEKSDTEIKQGNVTIEAGETLKYTYMVKVKEGVSTIADTVATVVRQYGEDTKTSTITNKLKNAELVVTLIPQYREEAEIKAGISYYYILKVINTSGTKLENVEVTLTNNELLKITGIEELSGEKISYSDGKFTIASLEVGETKVWEVYVYPSLSTIDITSARISTSAKTVSNNVYRSNEVIEPVIGMKLNVTATQSTNSKNTTGYVDVGDIVTYKIKVDNVGELTTEGLKIKNKFSPYLTIKSVTLNGNTVNYESIESYTEDNNIDFTELVITSSLGLSESIEVEIIAEVLQPNLKEDTTLRIVNKTAIYNKSAYVTETEELVYYLDGETPWDDGENSGSDVDNGNSEDNKQEGENGSNNNDNSNGNNTENKYSISGIAWLDSDEDGLKDINEQLLTGITVHAIRVDNNKVVATTTTDDEGFYVLKDLEEAQYLVVFEYDTNKYLVTKYQVDESQKTSDVIKSKISINGETKEVAVTDSINLISNTANVNLGLREIKVFDLDLNKYVSKIVVNNASGTKIYDQKDATTLAKVEIGSKYLNGTNVVVEYTIQVKNVGEVAGYAKSIVDYLPSELSFSSSLNSDWYQSGEYIYNKSLENTKIEPGETKELKVILTKAMTSSNTGLINNKADIASSYNSSEIKDKDSDESGSAEIIIGVKTGVAVSYIILILTIVIAICGVTYWINKKFLTDK